MIELVLFRNGTEVDKVAVMWRALDGADAESQLVVARRQRLDNVLCFSPARGMLRWQCDELFFIDVGNGQE